MRIISGSSKGRRLFAPSGLALRPTPGKVRSALFNILADRILDASFLDLYAGTGAVGLEALSRGALHTTFVEQSPRHLQYLRKNIAACLLEEQSTVRGIDAEDFLKTLSSPFDLVFLDPPYKEEALEKILPRLEQDDIITDAGRLIIEHFHKRVLPETIGNIHFLKQYRYGETLLSFYGTH
ncbi:MAG: 16S rRNA (guanine(966)-N(2))-methyltransferase RsmD [Nitrospirae bacterium]|nr:16S rRNA (guanine(966)-N(2))-methyltransferase RsmD [Candidatus Manganitrophaceae bacterium]